MPSVFGKVYLTAGDFLPMKIGGNLPKMECFGGKCEAAGMSLRPCYSGFPTLGMERVTATSEGSFGSYLLIRVRQRSTGGLVMHYQ